MSYVVCRLKKHGVSVFLIVISTIIRSTFALGMAGYSKYVFDGIESRSATFGNVLLLGLFVTAWGAVGLLLKNICIDSLVGRLSYDMRSGVCYSVSSRKIKRYGRRENPDRLFPKYRCGHGTGAFWLGINNDTF